MQTKTKKNVGYKIAISALVLLLTIAMILTATGAWFQDADNIDDNFVMGDPVNIKLEEGTAPYEKFEFTYAMPGDDLTGVINAVIPQKTAPMYIRGKLTFEITNLFNEATGVATGATPKATLWAYIEARHAALVDADTDEEKLALYPGKTQTQANDFVAAELTAINGIMYKNTALTGTKLTDNANLKKYLRAEGGTVEDNLLFPYLEDAALVAPAGATPGWVLGTDNMYYYSAVVNAPDDEKETIKLANAVSVPEGWTNFFHNASIVLNVQVEAMQAANCPWAVDGQPLDALIDGGLVAAYANVDRTPAGAPEG